MTVTPVLWSVCSLLRQVYFAFFVVSCGYLYIHSRRKPTPQPGLFALGSMAEAGSARRGTAAGAAAAAPEAPEAVEMDEDLPKRSDSKSPISTAIPMKKPQSKCTEEEIDESQS